MLFGKKKLIGLDIGANSVKLAEVNASSRHVTLEGFSMVNTPHGVIQNSGNIDGSEVVSEAVRQAVSELRTKRKLVASGLWGSSVVIKRITIPRIEEGLVGEQIRWEAEQYIPYDIKEVNLDYKVLDILGDVDGGGESENMDVLLVAAKQEAVFGVAEVIEMSGLSCSTVDIEGFALANCFERNYGVAAGELVGLFNIGAGVTNIVILQNGEIIFCRDVPVGGDTYTLALHRSMDITQKEAEQLKIGASRGDPTPDEAIAIVKSTHEVVLEELRTVVEFFMNTSQVQSLDRCYVSGGGSRTLGLEECLQQTYGVVRMDPLTVIKCNTKRVHSGILEQIKDLGAVAIGLALREPGDS